MKNFKVALFAALIGASTFAMAAESESAAAREHRMNEALERYHAQGERHESGRAERAEEHVKHGATRTGNAIKRGAHKVGHAINTGVHKTGAAIHRTGEKIEDKTTR